MGGGWLIFHTITHPHTEFSLHFKPLKGPCKYLLLTECEGRTGRISARGLGSTDRAASARSVQKRPRADILPVRPSHSVNKIYLLHDLTPGRADTEIPPIRSRDCRSDIFQVSDRFRAYQTGNRTFQNGGCGGDRGLQTFSSKHKAILVQATKAPTLSLVWTCETIWEDQRKLLNMKTAKSLRTAAEFQDFVEEHKSNLTRWGKLSRSHLAWSALVQRCIRQKNRNYSVNYSCTRNPTNKSVWFWQSSRAEYSLHLPFSSFLTLIVV